jgi:uncharacterized protein YaiL (DUF2058 family)
MINWDQDDDLIDGNRLDVEEDIYKEDDDEVLDAERERKLINVLDSDILKYFNEAQVIKKKPFNGCKKVKKEKPEYAVGQKIKVNNLEGTILFGPYEQNDKIMYEVETEKGVISIDYRSIKKI